MKTAEMHLKNRFVVYAVTALVMVPLGVGMLRVSSPAAVAAEHIRDLATAPPESVGVSSERLRRLDAGMKRMVDENRLAGVSTLMARHGKTIHFSAFGKKDITKGEPIQRDTIFRIASMTKPITGAAMMMLYEEGKWRLDDPVSKFIPEFSKLKVYAGQNADGSPKLEDARRPMTMRELMTHSAGLGYVLNETNPVDRMIRQGRVLDAGQPLQKMIDGLAKIPLLAQPGTRWYYSIGIDVQGYLVEKMSGQAFGEFLRTRIFDPLGMKDTSFYVPKDKLARLAAVHGDGQNGKLEISAGSAEAPTAPPAGPSGGGGLFSTADDYLRFGQMMLNGGELNGARLLAPRTVEMMRTNHLQEEALRTVRPGTGWGLGFNVIRDAAAAGEPYSNGTYYWFGIYGTWFWIDPVADLVVVGMIQHRGSTNGEVQAVSRSLAYQAIVNWN